jgi:hypothetical protein
MAATKRRQSSSLPIEDSAQTVIQASCCILFVIATVTDEEFSAHFCRGPSASKNVQSSGKNAILDGEIGYGEIELFSTRK